MHKKTRAIVPRAFFTYAAVGVAPLAAVQVAVVPIEACSSTPSSVGTALDAGSIGIRPAIIPPDAATEDGGADASPVDFDASPVGIRPAMDFDASPADDAGPVGIRPAMDFDASPASDAAPVGILPAMYFGDGGS